MWYSLLRQARSWFYELLPPLEEISNIESGIEPRLSEKSFLDDTDSIPDLEQVPEMTEIPSFLGTEYYYTCL